MGEDVSLLQDQKNMLFSSTVINYGSAIGIVVYTGMQTAIGRVQEEVKAASEEEEETPLKKKLNNFGELLSKIIGIICFLVWAMNYDNFDDEIHGSWIKGCIYYFKIAIALAVAAIPEGLPAVITTCLALGTRKMAANNAIVRRLPSVETLGCTSVICSDKTGTLTKNQMCAVKFAYIGNDVHDLKVHEIDEQSYNPETEIKQFTSDIFAKNVVMREIATVCAINNKAGIRYEDGQYVKLGEPTEAALKVFAEKLGRYDAKLGNKVDYTKEPEAYSKFIGSTLNRVAALDFTSERKLMSTVVTGFVSQGNSTLIKGAPERVIEKCSTYKNAQGNVANLTAADKQILNDQVKTFAKEGLRILGIATIYDAGKLRDLNAGNAEAMLSEIKKYSEFEEGGTFLGMVCIKDPVRGEVKSAIQDCKTAGIRVIMITGDSKETAVAIAKEINIIDPNSDISTNSFTGTEFDAFSDERKRAVLSGSGGKVFSRVEPRHKRELVKILIEMVIYLYTYNQPIRTKLLQ